MSTEKTSIEDSILIQPEQWGHLLDYQPLFGGVTMSMGGSDQIGRNDEGICCTDESIGGSDEIHGGTREGIGGSGLGKWWPIPSYIPIFLDDQDFGV